jgi:hypothetical protein
MIFFWLVLKLEISYGVEGLVILKDFGFLLEDFFEDQIMFFAW